VDATATDNEGSLKNDASEEKNAVAEEQGEVEYEKGMRLALIIVSLLLSIFLVGPITRGSSCERYSHMIGCPGHDNRRHSNSENYR
jgi:hypothetical protein